MTAPLTACPKRMTYGPCGGVRANGGCEMAPEPCVFGDPVLDVPEVPATPPRRVPMVLGDLTAPPFDADALGRVAEIMAPTCNALLVGEHHNRPDLPPAVVTQIVRDHGGDAWITLACRDRNRVVLEQELHGLRYAGADAVLCVTGDGRGPDVRPDVTQVWDLDGPRLTTLAATVGMTAAVPETPTAPPGRRQRAARLVAKQRAGAAIAVLNHVTDPADVAVFIAEARELGLLIPVIAAVAVYTDPASAAALDGLPGLELDPSRVRDVLAAPDIVEAGINAAVDEAIALLSIDGVAGVNLSGSASTRGWQHGAEVKAEIGRRIAEVRA